MCVRLPQTTATVIFGCRPHWDLGGFPWVWMHKVPVFCKMAEPGVLFMEHHIRGAEIQAAPQEIGCRLL